MTRRKAISCPGSRLALEPVLCLAVLLPMAGCTGTDPLVSKSTRVYREVMAQDPQYATYGLEVASRSSAPFAQELLLEAIGSSQRQTALEAARALSGRPFPSARESLQTLFSTEHGLIQMESAIALARLGDPSARSWLRQNVAEAAIAPNPAIVRLLAELGEEEILRPVLEEGMKAEEQTARDEIYALLGDIHQPWATELLLNGLDREFGEGRKQAIVALGRTGDPSVAPRIRRFVETRGLVFATLEALGSVGNETSIPVLERMFEKPQKLVKVYAGAALWKLGRDEQARVVLGALIADEDPVVRLNLAEQLGGVLQDDVLPMVATLCDDEDRRVRIAALRALRERAEQGLEEVLLERVEDPDYQAAVVALDALGRLGGPGALSRLEALLENENGYVAISAANAILEIKAREEAIGTGS